MHLLLSPFIDYEYRVGLSTLVLSSITDLCNLHFVEIAIAYECSNSIPPILVSARNIYNHRSSAFCLPSTCLLEVNNLLAQTPESVKFPTKVHSCRARQGFAPKSCSSSPRRCHPSLHHSRPSTIILDILSPTLIKTFLGSFARSTRGNCGYKTPRKVERDFAKTWFELQVVEEGVRQLRRRLLKRSSVRFVSIKSEKDEGVVRVVMVRQSYKSV